MQTQIPSSGQRKRRYIKETAHNSMGKSMKLLGCFVSLFPSFLLGF